MIRLFFDRRTAAAYLPVVFALLIVLPGSPATPGCEEIEPTRGFLTVESIMRDPAEWLGTSPDNIRWSENGDKIFFTWRTAGDEDTGLFAVDGRGGVPARVSPEKQATLPSPYGATTRNRAWKVYSRNGDLFLYDVKRGRERQLTDTLQRRSDPRFSFDEKKIVFSENNNLFLFDLESGKIEQVTQFVAGPEPRESPKTELQTYLEKQQLELFRVLRDRREDREKREALRKSLEPRRPAPIHLGTRRVFGAGLSPDERYVTYILVDPAGNVRSTIVPDYVTESGYTETLTSRSKVGDRTAGFSFHVYDREAGTAVQVKTETLPGILPPGGDESEKKTRPRDVRFDGPHWSDDGRKAFVQLRSLDNKDRWIVLFDPEQAAFTTVLEHQRDEAWIGGPGIGWTRAGVSLGWMPDSKRVFFQSEETGYSHLYVVDIDGKNKRPLTEGLFEISDAFLSRDKTRWYFHSNEEHFGERHFYSMPLEGGARTRLTPWEGGHDAVLSPDEKRVALRYSYMNRIPELFVMDNRAGAVPVRITESRLEEFRRYDWRVPDLVTFEARDGARVPARLYQPEQSNGAAVIFVHGAGYLQNAHKWWSSYFREYMFHNLLADKGYTVLDIDYRGSAGLGRDWRTAIYRHMGGRDLDDHVDGARFLVDRHGVDPARIGIYGGSYGGFITFMAMFTEPGVFAAGAALRPVSDWAHYSHGYTSDILNVSYEDDEAYRRSSPIYHAEGLEGALLICAPMVDTNVHFQDVVRLVQRLIELRKENWEVALYPVENHGFTGPESWMDEYKRILKLFEDNLNLK
jgi:dipeptidyl aminopeptidase/acylaminoacyl peptidase